MNKQRKVLITTTYNEMGIIMDTKTEEVQLATDTISRQAAIDALDCINGVEEVLRSLPSAQPEIIRCEYCTHRNQYRFPPKYEVKDYCEVHEKVTTLNNFCSWADRR